MLIFEGPDNSGKSTIASYVSHELGIPLWHFGKPPSTVEQLRKRIHFMLDNKDFLIFDRIPLISEPVYSMLRNKNLMSSLTDSGEVYYKKLRDIKPIIVYCRPPLGTIIEAFHHGKEYDTKEHLASVEEKQIALINRYDEIMRDSRLPPHWNFDYTTQEHDSFLEKIEDEIINRKHYSNFYKETEI